MYEVDDNQNLGKFFFSSPFGFFYADNKNAKFSLSLSLNKGIAYTWHFGVFCGVNSLECSLGISFL